MTTQLCLTISSKFIAFVVVEDSLLYRSLSYFCGAVETSLTVTSKTKAHACSNVNKGPKIWYQYSICPTTCIICKYVLSYSSDFQNNNNNIILPLFRKMTWCVRTNLHLLLQTPTHHSQITYSSQFQVSNTCHLKRSRRW